MRIHTVRQRPGWRRRLIDASGSVPSLSTLRVLRAVEQREKAGQSASIGEVAGEHGRRALHRQPHRRQCRRRRAADQEQDVDDQRRWVLTLTDAGRRALADVTERRREMVAETVAEWPESDVDKLVDLLEQLVTDFERGTCS